MTTPLFSASTVRTAFGSVTFAVDEDAALLDKLAGFTVGAAQTRGDHGGQQADTTVLDSSASSFVLGIFSWSAAPLNRPRAVACAFSASSPWTIFVSS